MLAQSFALLLIFRNIIVSMYLRLTNLLSFKIFEFSLPLRAQTMLICISYSRTEQIHVFALHGEKNTVK